MEIINLNPERSFLMFDDPSFLEYYNEKFLKDNTTEELTLDKPIDIHVNIFVYWFVRQDKIKKVNILQDDVEDLQIFTSFVKEEDTSITYVHKIHYPSHRIFDRCEQICSIDDVKELRSPNVKKVYNYICLPWNYRNISNFNSDTILNLISEIVLEKIKLVLIKVFNYQSEESLGKLLLKHCIDLGSQNEPVEIKVLSSKAIEQLVYMGLKKFKHKLSKQDHELIIINDGTYVWCISTKISMEQYFTNGVKFHFLLSRSTYTINDFEEYFQQDIDLYNALVSDRFPLSGFTEFLKKWNMLQGDDKNVDLPKLRKRIESAILNGSV